MLALAVVCSRLGWEGRVWCLREGRWKWKRCSVVGASARGRGTAVRLLVARGRAAVRRWRESARVRGAT